MQLDALLRSMDEYFSQSDDIIITYWHTSELHEQAYSLLINKHPNVNFLKRTTLKNDTESVLENSKLICFLVDDDVFYRDVDIIPEIGIHETYSLRLGENVKNKAHFNYTISIDGNIFRSEDILKFAKQIEYITPNHFEGRLVPFQNRFIMKWNEQYLVGIPHNRVSDSSGCKFTGKYSEDELAEMYLQGKRIDYKAMDFSNIGSVHADIDYKFYEVLS